MELFVVIFTLMVVGVCYKWRREIAHWLSSKPWPRSGLQYDMSILRKYNIPDRIGLVLEKEREVEHDNQLLSHKITTMKADVTKQVEAELAKEK